MKRRVEFTYVKEIKFVANLEQEELDKIVLKGEIPNWIDETMDDIDNEQPAEFKGFRVLKEK